MNDELLKKFLIVKSMPNPYMVLKQDILDRREVIDLDSFAIHINYFTLGGVKAGTIAISTVAQTEECMKLFKTADTVKKIFLRKE